MPIYNNFIQSLLPGNYALTKSMELTKIQDAGTLWYTKKFLTLYYYVFLSNDIMTTAYQQAVVGIFDTYIDSLPESVRERARLYFYPENDAINFKSDNFNLFSNFASFNIFTTQEERNSYYQSAKKYYFALLMGSGGQTGIKKKLKEAVQRPGFVYSRANIDEIILHAAIEGCTREANAEQSISDNSIKRILSKKTMDTACKIARERQINESDLHQLNKVYPHNNPEYRGIESDMIAFVRNERQILYYYGYFHSKSTGANDFEFSSLTPIGELALKANAKEFLIIWEHQKIKMISQPATADINQVFPVVNSAQNFGISYTPYTDILGFLLRREAMSLDEYKYIVSRKKHKFNDDEWQKEEDNIIAHLDDIRKIVDGFGRRSDQAEEDGRKELLKYLLGVRNDLSNDSNCNPLGILKFRNSTVTIANRDALALLYDIYSKLEGYKIQKYETVFENSERDLRRRYMSAINGESSTIDNRVKIYWDLYNIHPDNLIMLCSAIITSAIELQIKHVESMSKECIDAVSLHIYENYRALFTTLGMRTLNTMRKEIQRALAALRRQNYSEYLRTNVEHDQQTLARYRSENANDLRVRIIQVSENTTVTPTENRERNATLVSLLKSYYMRCFADNNMLKCECCGEETFITYAGEPYVEFHHLIPFNIAYGPDHYLNLFALCPACHRKMHFLRIEDKKEKYDDLSKNNYMHLDFTERLRKLREQNLLRSYHLEFLLADSAITLEEYNSIAA